MPVRYSPTGPHEPGGWGGAPLIEIGDNLESLLTTAVIFGTIAVSIWATNRPARRERRDRRREGE